MVRVENPVSNCTSIAASVPACGKNVFTKPLSRNGSTRYNILINSHRMNFMKISLADLELLNGDR
jgi:hypothetical protein